MSFEVFGGPVVFHLGPIPVTETMLGSLGPTVALVVVAWLSRRAVTSRPDGYFAALSTWTLEWLDDLVLEVVGARVPSLVTFSGSLFLFIVGCNLAGQLPGVRAPTSDLATTSALAVLVFVMVPAAGIHARGVRGYLRHYFRPNPLLFPIHIISEISRTFALALRLFGNMMSGYLIVALLVALTGLFVPMPLMALDLLIGLLQAYIFTILAVVYIGAALRAGEEG